MSLHRRLRKVAGSEHLGEHHEQVVWGDRCRGCGLGELLQMAAQSIDLSNLLPASETVLRHQLKR
jgi:hypothetical protein